MLKKKDLKTYAVVITAALVLSVIVTGKQFSTPVIGVIEINDVIQSTTIDGAIEALERARRDDSIKAVVLDIDSPGGEASASSELYLAVLRLREKKPVVASIDSLGASGAYEVAVAADEIYAKPTSAVVHIGVVSFLPEPVQTHPSLIFTSPLKLTGSTKAQAFEELDAVYQQFIGVVKQQRGDRLKADETELRLARVYLGVDAQRLGFIDALGSKSDAIERAAELAGTKHNYRVEKLGGTEQFPFVVFLQSMKNGSLSKGQPLYYKISLPVK